MKAHVGLSGPVKKEFIREWNEQSTSMTRKMFKIFAWVMHEEGYGAYRINRCIDKISDLMVEKAKDEIFWRHMDKALRDLGVPFDPEDYDKEEEGNLEN